MYHTHVMARTWVLWDGKKLPCSLMIIIGAAEDDVTTITVPARISKPDTDNSRHKSVSATTGSLHLGFGLALRGARMAVKWVASRRTRNAAGAVFILAKAQWSQM